LRKPSTRVVVKGGSRGVCRAADAPDSELGVEGRALQQALELDELRLHYQPKVSLDSDLIVGVEALLRWERPGRGMVSPLEFIPLAEETGLIVAIGSWVVEEACLEAARWRRSFPDRALVVSVNLSARQFRPGLVDVVARALEVSGTEPRHLCLEVTESLLMHDREGSAVILQQLAGLGVSLSIDDFGTGYSSFAYLKWFALNELKIDKSFIDGLGQNDDDTAIVASIVAMAHALGLSVVAEGVETADQLQRLRTLGCQEAQGFHFARPGPPREIDVMLRAETAPSWRSHHRSPTEGGTPETYRPDRILVVDDDSDVRQLVRMSLTAVGFEVHEAADGVEAMLTAQLVQPDCVLVDLLMPGVSGLELCRLLRAEPTTADCTILLLTSNDDAANKVEAFSVGADDYVIKPFSPSSLVNRVQGAMRRRGEAQSVAMPAASELLVTS
jgi:EAL domain-containing protein (putative c-di-GMP-specific phosphodiesterase class I)/CheY-like chemotaxis protein